MVCYIAGYPVNLDSMFDSSIPDGIERCKISSEDPIAAAKYFNLVIVNLFDKLLAYNNPNGGILGHVKSYYGILEEQGRGN